MLRVDGVECVARGESRHAIDALRRYDPHRATYIDYLNYVWQALAIAGLQDRTYNAPPGAGLDTGEQVLKTRLKLPDYTGSWKKNYWVNIGILAGFILFFRAAAVIVVARRLSR